MAPAALLNNYNHALIMHLSFSSAMLQEMHLRRHYIAELLQQLFVEPIVFENLLEQWDLSLPSLTWR